MMRAASTPRLDATCTMLATLIKQPSTVSDLMQASGTSSDCVRAWIAALHRAKLIRPRSGEHRRKTITGMAPLVWEWCGGGK